MANQNNNLPAFHRDMDKKELYTILKVYYDFISRQSDMLKTARHDAEIAKKDVEVAKKDVEMAKMNAVMALKSLKMAKIMKVFNAGQSMKNVLEQVKPVLESRIEDQQDETCRDTSQNLLDQNLLRECEELNTTLSDLMAGMKDLKVDEEE